MMANPPYYTKKTMKAGVYLGYLYIKPVMPGARAHTHTHTHRALATCTKPCGSTLGSLSE